MQSEILQFEFKEKECSLFGNFSDLRPVHVDGIAHAIETDGTYILTFFSETGLIQGEKKICSADLRIAMTPNNIRELAEQLSKMLPANGSAAQAEISKEVEPQEEPIREELGPELR